VHRRLAVWWPTTLREPNSSEASHSDLLLAFVMSYKSVSHIFSTPLGPKPLPDETMPTGFMRAKNGILISEPTSSYRMAGPPRNFGHHRNNPPLPLHTAGDDEEDDGVFRKKIRPPAHQPAQTNEEMKYSPSVSGPVDLILVSCVRLAAAPCSIVSGLSHESCSPHMIPLVSIYASCSSPIIQLASREASSV
jgi:hypothetical protein